jgi:hypothetical protein
MMVDWITAFNSGIRNYCIKGLQKIGQTGFFAGQQKYYDFLDAAMGRLSLYRQRYIQA